MRNFDIDYTKWTFISEICFLQIDNGFFLVLRIRGSNVQFQIVGIQTMLSFRY